MCVIIVKRRGARLPNRTVLKACYDTNPDGCGMMYVHRRGGKVTGDVQWLKGLLDFETFYREFTSRVQVDDTAVVHFRKATAGSVCVANTHPFPVVADFPDMSAAAGTAKAVLMHNGSINLHKEAEDISDSMQLARILAQTGIHRRACRSAAWATVMEQLIGRSRVAVLTAAGRVYRYGQDWTVIHGLVFSNLRWTKNIQIDKDKPRSLRLLPPAPATTPAEFAPVPTAATIRGRTLPGGPAFTPEEDYHPLPLKKKETTEVVNSSPRVLKSLQDLTFVPVK